VLILHGAWLSTEYVFMALYFVKHRDHVTFTFTIKQIGKKLRWRQHGPPKRWYPTTSLHGVTSQKTATRIFTAVKTSSRVQDFHFKFVSLTRRWYSFVI